MGLDKSAPTVAYGPSGPAGRLPPYDVGRRKNS